MINRIVLFATILLCVGAFGQSVSSNCSTGPVTAYTQSTSPVPITLTGTMPATGTQVVIAGVTTPAAMNGTWTITNTGAHTATLNGSGSMTGTLSAGSSTVNISFPNGAVCIQAHSATGSSTGISNFTISGGDGVVTVGTGHSILFFGYLCSNTGGNCAGTDNGSRLTIGDNINSTESCFSLSPSSPVDLQTTGAPGDTNYFNYAWYCPSAPAGITSFTLTCTVASTCSFISAFMIELTGMCTTAPCFDGDGIANVAGTSISPVTSSGSYTNDFVAYLGGSNNDPLMTAAGGCTQFDQTDQGNQTGGKSDTAAGTHTCTITYGASDNLGVLIVAVKSATSALGGPTVHAGRGGKSGMGGKSGTN